MSTTAISIIVPVFNAEKYLAKCIDSIINQTYNDWELILVDDGSTDKSYGICDHYKRQCKNISVITTSRGGVSKARNLGLEIARGEFILFVDSDDYLSPTHLEQYANVMNNYDITFQGYSMFDCNIVHTYSLKDMSSDSDNKMDILSRVFKNGNQFGSVWSKIFRRDIIEKWNLRFKRDLSIREDEIFTFEYCQYIQSVKVLATVTYNYRMTPNSLMRRKFMPPEELLKAMNTSYQAALQLPLTTQFRAQIDSYYRDSLRWAYWMLFYPEKLSDSSFRMQFYDVLIDWEEKHPELSTRLIKVNVQISDYLQLMKYAVKVMINRVQNL